MNKCKILIVDDEQFVREHFENHIPWADAGISWMGAAVHGQQALQMMERELPDIVLTDITMPVMDGISFAQQVKERWPQVAIIFLTAHDEFSYAQQAIGLGAKNYLLKMGLSKEKILEACQQAVEGKLLMKQEQSNQEELWQQKKQFIEAYLYNQPTTELEQDLEAVLHLQDQYYVYVVITCHWQEQQDQWNEQRLKSQQRQMANVIENWTTELVSDRNIAVFPLGEKDFVVQISIAQRFRMQLMQQLVHQFQDEITTVLLESFQTKCRIIMSAIGSNIEERNEKLSNVVRKVEEMFYACEWQHGFYLEKYNRVQQLEQAAKITKLLRQKEWAAFMAEVHTLTTIQTPLLSPLYLLNVAKMVLEHMTDIPSNVIRQYAIELKRITAWQQYSEWWRLLLVELAIPLQWMNKQQTVRKEIQWLCDRIATSVDQELSIRVLADEMQMNSAYLGQLFKQETGEYLSDYITKVRMEKAKDLLQKADMKIYEVAQRVGIDDYRYFCKMFKERVGTTPTAYKRSIL